MSQILRGSLQSNTLHPQGNRVRCGSARANGEAFLLEKKGSSNTPTMHRPGKIRGRRVLELDNLLREILDDADIDLVLS
jgi:hypothetical protein